jgi:hypothetical protein
LLSSGLMIIIMLFSSSIQLVLEISLLLVMLGSHIFFLISVIDFSTILMLLLCFEIRFESILCGVKFWLVIPMFLLLNFNRLSGFSDCLMELHSSRLVLNVSIGVCVDILFVIVNDGGFGVQSDDRSLQSFDFNFLVGNHHLGIVELDLQDLCWIILHLHRWSGFLWWSKGFSLSWWHIFKFNFFIYNLTSSIEAPLK